MTLKQLHIVAFNNPYPPNFGGAIDMFYKVKALAFLGVKIHLHIYTHERQEVSGLKPYCSTITFYKRNQHFIKHFSLLPFSVNSRNSDKLYSNLTKVKAPIIFESLRSCYLLRAKIWNQKIAVRCHNIEHDYSWGLSNSEANILKRIAHFVEGYKQKWFETVLNKADVLFPISEFEYDYYSKNFEPRTIFLPVFQGNDVIKSLDGIGRYALYHGDLSTSDNIKSALFLIDIFKDLDKPLVIASSVRVNSILSKIEQYSNISFKYVNREEVLLELVKNAHINTMYSFQRSGTKLKVFTALYSGRHCIINKNMVDDPDILRVCSIAETKKDYMDAAIKLFDEDFKVTKSRQKALKKYDSSINAKKIVEALF